MYLDLTQILIASCGVTALQGALMAVMWLQDRGARWLLWKGGVFVLGGAFLLLSMIGDQSHHVLSVGLGNATLFAACFACWSAARVFEGRRVEYLVLAGVEAGWLALCLVPHAFDSLTLGVGVQSTLAAAFLAGAAAEHWVNRNRPRYLNRWALIGLYGAVAVFFLARLPLLPLLPFPFGIQPAQIGWIAAFVFGLDIAAMILSFLSIMLTKERAEHELRAFAFTDALTGLLNRRAFAVDVARVAQRHLRSHQSYSLVMFDLDHFKGINDRYGHEHGDAVLRNFATVAQSILPDRNAIYRLGGEEFCCILPETDATAAARVANALRVTFRSTPVLHNGQAVVVSLSAGVGGSGEAGNDPVAVQSLADGALYRAKRLGRDRVCSGAHEPAPDEDISWAAA